MQRHHGLPAAGRSSDARRPSVSSANRCDLGGMQIRHPLLQGQPTGSFELGQVDGLRREQRRLGGLTRLRSRADERHRRSRHRATGRRGLGECSGQLGDSGRGEPLASGPHPPQQLRIVEDMDAAGAVHTELLADEDHAAEHLQGRQTVRSQRLLDIGYLRREPRPASRSRRSGPATAAHYASSRLRASSWCRGR